MALPSLSALHYVIAESIHPIATRLVARRTSFFARARLATTTQLVANLLDLCQHDLAQGTPSRLRASLNTFIAEHMNHGLMFQDIKFLCQTLRATIMEMVVSMDPAPPLATVLVLENWLQELTLGSAQHYSARHEEIIKQQQAQMEIQRFELQQRRQNETMLEHYKTELEEQVARRTFELTMMNQELQRLSTELAIKNDHLHRELEMAQALQVGLLPTRPPWNTERLAVCSRSLPAYEVGGDLYAYFSINDEAVGIVIGDISGKGVAAALMMAITISAIEMWSRGITRPGTLLELLNARLHERLCANHMNAALLCVIMDVRQGTLVVANAGMISPYLIRAGAVSSIDAVGLPLGCLAEASYQDIELVLQPNDVLVLVSDGIVEAQNLQRTMFGFDRLEALLGRVAPTTTPSRLVETLFAEVHAFVSSADQHDDMTVMALRPMHPVDTL